MKTKATIEFYLKWCTSTRMRCCEEKMRRTHCRIQVRKKKLEQLWKMKRGETWSTHGNDCLTSVDWVTNRYKLNTEIVKPQIRCCFSVSLQGFFLPCRQKCLSEYFLHDWENCWRKTNKNTKINPKSLIKYPKLISRLSPLLEFVGIELKNFVREVEAEGEEEKSCDSIELMLRSAQNIP